MKRRAFLAGYGAAATAARASAQIPLHPIIPGQPTTPARQMTIGVNVPLSGDLGVYGAQVVQGVKAAIDENNLLSANITQIVYGVRQFDDHNSAAISAGNASIAAADPTIVGLVGNLTGDVAVATLPQYANSGFAVVVPSVTALALTQRGYHNVYRLPTRDDVAGRQRASRVQLVHEPLAVRVHEDPALAAVLLDRVITGCLADDVPEIVSLGRTLKRWWAQILAHHTTGASNGPTEAMNLLVKKIKRCGHGFRSFSNYRLRVLLHCGGIKWNAHPTTTMRGRSPQLVA